MELREPLTLENFWNEIKAQFPKAMAIFCDWIDEYKKATSWNDLFGNNRYRYEQIKFHDIPHAMQQGIWLEFIHQNLPKYAGDGLVVLSVWNLREDIKLVMGIIEGAVREPQDETQL